HIAACEICGAEAESLKRILARAAELPKSIDPPAQAWSSIRTAILREEAAGIAHNKANTLPFWRRRLILAAAGVVVAVLSSAGTALYMTSRSSGATAARATTNSPGSTTA